MSILSKWTDLNNSAAAKSEAMRQSTKDKKVAKATEGAEKRLVKDTRKWTMPVVLRHYEPGDEGDALFQTEAASLLDHGYQTSLMSEDGGHVHAGRLILTGGLSILAGKKGIRSKGRMTVTFTRGN